ncbi:MAG TPA: hypothetical protein PKH32_11110, partial [Verrucomicrobiota bacterium]|nr:hypothetical protein [Verrucomicrobiota bacterium]
MIEFVLDDARPQAGRTETSFAPALVVTNHLDALGSRDTDLDVRQAQATFDKFSRLAGLSNLRVGEAELLSLNRAHQHALLNGDLWSSQANACMHVHQRKHFLDEIAQGAVV